MSQHSAPTGTFRPRHGWRCYHALAKQKIIMDDDFLRTHLNLSLSLSLSLSLYMEETFHT